MAEKKIYQESVPSMVAMDSSIAQLGQYIVPQTEGPFDLASIFVYVTKTGVPDSALITLYVYDDTGADGTAGTLLASSNSISTGDMTVPGWVEFTLDTSVTMYNGTGYWVLALAAFWSVEEAPASNYWSLGYSAANPYASGVAATIDLFNAYTYLAGDLGFQLWAADALSLSAVAPLHEATGVKLAPSTLEWECPGFDAETMVFDVYFRMFGVTQFTQVGDGQTDVTLTLPDNLVYNFLYFWKVNVRDVGTDELLLEGDEWNFNTEALIKYPVPRSRTVPAPGGGTMVVQTAENSVAAIKYLVAASQNKLFYEYVAGT